MASYANLVFIYMPLNTVFGGAVQGDFAGCSPFAGVAPAAPLSSSSSSFGILESENPFGGKGKPHESMILRMILKVLSMPKPPGRGAPESESKRTPKHPTAIQEIQELPKKIPHCHLKRRSRSINILPKPSGRSHKSTKVARGTRCWVRSNAEACAKA